MTEHTPGPWRVDPDFEGDIQTADGKLEIASSDEGTLHCGDKPIRSEQFANAHLIAAAPDLLFALIELHGDCVAHGIISAEEDQRITSLVARAKGQTP